MAEPRPFFCGVRASDATHPGGFRPGQTKPETRGRRATTLARRGPRGSAGPAADVCALDEGLRRLAALSPRQSRVVELRYFGGLTDEEVSKVLDVSPRTVRNDWRLARAWLYRELSQGDGDDA